MNSASESRPSSYLPHCAVGLLAMLLLATVGACALRERDVMARDHTTWVDRTLAEMTIDQKVSQLFATAANGRFLNDDDPEYRRLVRLVEEFQVGGVVFFRGDPYSQAVLTNDLQARSPIPLLISQDMEWGAGMRIDRSTTFPRAMAIGAAGNASLAYEMGRVVAAEAGAIGVHMNFAPVADINNNPANPVINVRAYGATADLVTDMAGAFARGMQDGGLLAVAKHFPGHGDTAADSHIDLPVLPFTRSRLDSVELKPFRSLIDQGIAGVMVAHVALPKIEEDRSVPATLSPSVITGILRDDLQFDGLVVTDAMRMVGVTKNFGSGEAAVRAIEAGVDMLVLPDDFFAARRAVMHAVDAGRLTEGRIDNSVRRLLRAKYDAGLAAYKPVNLENVHRVVGRADHQAVSNRIARESVTVLVNDNSFLPITATRPHILLVALGDSDDPDEGRYFLKRVEDALPYASVELSLIDRRSHADDFAQVRRKARTVDVVLAASFVRVRTGSGSISLPKEQADLLETLAAAKPPLVLVSFGNPYLIMDLANVDAYVATFGASHVSQKAAAEAVTGRIKVAGRLPVNIPGKYEQGFGIQLKQEMLRWGNPLDVGLDAALNSRVASLIEASIADTAFPGAAVVVGRGGTAVVAEGFGYQSYDSEEAISTESVFDLASLTKVVATTPAVMMLFDRGQIELDAPVASYLPEFGVAGKERVTVRHLLTHTGGLAAFYAFYRQGIRDRQAIIDFIMQDSLRHEPGTTYRYSDLGMITLGLVVERITGQALGDFLKDNLWQPLGMINTGFRLTGRPGMDPGIVPTEVDTMFRMRLMQGEVHDEAAWSLGGTAGHAGLFSSARDVSRYVYMLLNGGRANGRQLLNEETVRLFTTRFQNQMGHTRALGWDTRSSTGYSSAGSRFGPKSFGHTGFTGTSIWIDPDSKLFVILLTNRVHPTRANRKISAVRPALADIVAESVIGDPVTPSLNR